MILFMSGYPYAGKSVAAKMIVDELPFAATIIDPKTWRCDNYDALNEDDKKDENLSIWETTLELLEETIKKTADNEITIYDTACANRERMLPLFKEARKHHHVLFVFVKAPLSKCAERAGDKWFSNEVIDKYTKSFEENISVFGSTAHKFHVVSNETDEAPSVRKVVDYIVNFYGSN